uniref:hypothetical protein n=1 Tax=Paenibacillus durus TaxID=44251 RepID=UPI000559FB5F
AESGTCDSLYIHSPNPHTEHPLYNCCQDYKKCELKDNGLCTTNLFNRIQELKLYQVITHKELLNQEHEETIHRIEHLAEQFYLYTSERNIFNYLTTYIEEHKEILKEELRVFM